MVLVLQQAIHDFERLLDDVDLVTQIDGNVMKEVFLEGVNAAILEEGLENPLNNAKNNEREENTNCSESDKSDENTSNSNNELDDKKENIKNCVETEASEVSSNKISKEGENSKISEDTNEKTEEGENSKISKDTNEETEREEKRNKKDCFKRAFGFIVNKLIGGEYGEHVDDLAQMMDEDGTSIEDITDWTTDAIAKAVHQKNHRKAFLASLLTAIVFWIKVAIKILKRNVEEYLLFVKRVTSYLTNTITGFWKHLCS